MFNKTNENVAAAKGLRGMSRKTKWVALGVAGAMFFGGGAAVGTTLPDPKASDAYVALAADVESVEAELGATENDYTALEEDYETLSSGIEEREAVLNNGNRMLLKRSRRSPMPRTRSQKRKRL